MTQLLMQANQFSAVNLSPNELIVYRPGAAANSANPRQINKAKLILSKFDRILWNC